MGLIVTVALLIISQLLFFRRANAMSRLIHWSNTRGIPQDPPEPGRPPLRHAFLPPSEVLPTSSDECADALHIPKVALMFLTKGILLHERTWELWFKSAEGVLPAQAINDAICNGDTLYQNSSPAAARACKRNSTNVIDRQHLFSVYVHAPPTFPNYTESSMWKGRLVRHRVTTIWGSHTLVEATRNLLWEAYRDPLNTRFVLLSESDIPLYDPLTFYQQLQAETKSRVDTCRHHKTSPWRWDPHMESGDTRMTFHHWRKSSQWFTLIREHVDLVLRDEFVYRKFERYCWSAWDAVRRRWYRDCFSDEHYFATLLAVENRDKEGVCESGGVAYKEWQGKAAHPTVFLPAVIDTDLIIRARSAQRSAAGAPTAECRWAEAYTQAQKLFLPVNMVLSSLEISEDGNNATTSGLCNPDRWADNPPTFTAVLLQTCYLTARKFPTESRDRVREVFLQCNNEVNLLKPDICVAEGGTNCSNLWHRLKRMVSRDCR
jgi:hypothetical protein